MTSPEAPQASFHMVNYGRIGTQAAIVVVSAT